jgi:hypothetical protein
MFVTEMNAQVSIVGSGSQPTGARTSQPVRPGPAL